MVAFIFCIEGSAFNRISLAPHALAVFQTLTCRSNLKNSLRAKKVTTPKTRQLPGQPLVQGCYQHHIPHFEGARKPSPVFQFTVKCV